MRVRASSGAGTPDNLLGLGPESAGCLLPGGGGPCSRKPAWWQFPAGSPAAAGQALGLGQQRQLRGVGLRLGGFLRMRRGACVAAGGAGCPSACVSSAITPGRVPAVRRAPATNATRGQHGRCAQGGLLQHDLGRLRTHPPVGDAEADQQVGGATSTMASSSKYQRQRGTRRLGGCIKLPGRWFLCRGGRRVKIDLQGRASL